MWGEYGKYASIGELDAVVLNAGMNRVGAVETNSEKDFDDVMNTNLKGVWLWLRLVVPVLKAQGRGQIVVTNSVMGIRGRPEAG
jgi:3-oxoacyl-[acyl-carrier protein] reductase